ncbi:MFS transporter [Rhodoluna lacicola]|uniref:Arabinose efflux permease n=1 Tax=Rhodoluna lacicola TaxID=529884 RepID=A0A060JNH1_9MICO|nr:MFS transporter [Rhodoluna lacicola]AIC47734.1 Arabinose efflux permease [Rhodoluna lacicola]
MSSNRPAFQARQLALPVYVPSLLFAAGESGLIPLIPASAENLGADLPTAAFVAGLVLIGTLIADLPAATIVNRFGERVSMIWAGFIAALGAGLALMASNIYLLGAGVFLLGMTAAIFGLARHSYIAETAPKEFRARSLSILGGMFRLGGFIGPLVGAWIIQNYGIQNVYWMSIIFCGLAGAILLTTKAEKMPDTPPNRAGGIWVVAKLESKKLLSLGVASAMLTFLRTVRHLALPLWALHINLDLSVTALIIGLAGAIDFALFYNGGQVIDKYGRRFAAVPTMLAIGIGVACIPFTSDATSFAIVAVALAVANALGSGLVLTIGADLAPEGARNEFLAAFRLLLDGGIAIAAPVISLLTIAVGLSSGLFAVSGVALVGAYLMNHYLPKYGIR